jgi:NAD(P)-dependent dehydrogenase (short-subunit alcohol dehydrogenase family)
MITIDLTGKTAIITGGASGIGRTGAERFIEAGAHVVIVDIDEAAAHKVADEIDPSGATVVAHGADVADEGQLAAAFDLAVERFGGIDCVWNNAGVETLGPIAMATTDAFRQLFDVNVLGVILGTKLALTRLPEGGSILNTASVAGLSGIPMQVLYAASKAAVVSVTKTAALEGSGRSIRANCLCPAIVDTPMLAAAMGAEPSPELKARLGASAPLGRLIRPEEIADAAAFLTSDLASFISGHALAVDGAMTAGPRLDIADLVGAGPG